VNNKFVILLDANQVLSLDDLGTLPLPDATADAAAN
jgi:hypothetical protein